MCCSPRARARGKIVDAIVVVSSVGDELTHQLEESACSKRHEPAALGQDHMVQHPDSVEFAYLDEAAGNGKILFARFRIAAWVVVHEDDGSG